MEQRIHRVQSVRDLDESAYVLRLDRHDLPFEPGQCIGLGVPGTIAMRDYSIYSAAQDDYLEVLVREVRGGLVSRALRRCSPGDPLLLEPPHGLFVTTAAARSSARFLFVATGTGIAPFRCIARSFPALDYLLLHGVRSGEERYELECFPVARRICCSSRGAGGSYRGRVTAWLREHPVDASRLCYLCGNGDMTNEAFAILRDQGIPRERIFAEVYF